MSDTILVTAAGAAKMLAMGRSTFWANVKIGKLPQPVRIGGLTRWRVTDLQQHVQAMPTTTPSDGADPQDKTPGCTPPVPHQSLGALAGAR